MIVAFLNQKGGVGKTSCCFHLAGTLALQGQRVLLVDNDPQASLTQGFIGPRWTAELDPRATIAGVYAGQNPFPGILMRGTGMELAELVPGSAGLNRYNRPMEDGPDETSGRLRDWLASIAPCFAWTLIDCPPNLGGCAVAALLAADAVVVPTQAEDFGAQGLGPVAAAVAAIRAEGNPALGMLGYLITMFDRRQLLPKLYEGQLRAMYGAEVFTAMVPRAVDFQEAIYRRKPVARHRPKGMAARAMDAVALELQARAAALVAPVSSGRGETNGVAAGHGRRRKGGGQ